MFIGIRNDFLNATLCSSSVNEFNVQLLEWGVFFFPGHVQWFVAAVCVAAVFMVSPIALRCRPKGCLCSEETTASSARGWQIWAIVALWAGRWEIYTRQHILSLHHAALHFSFPEILFSLKTCLKCIFMSTNCLWSQIIGEKGGLRF